MNCRVAPINRTLYIKHAFHMYVIRFLLGKCSNKTESCAGEVLETFNKQAPTHRTPCCACCNEGPHSCRAVNEDITYYKAQLACHCHASVGIQSIHSAYMGRGALQPQKGSKACCIVGASCQTKSYISCPSRCGETPSATDST